MSDVPPDLARPAPPPTWRDHGAAFAESLDLSPRRLAVGAAVLAIAGLIAWRMLAPPAGPPEMDLPFAEPGAGPANAAAGDGDPGGPGAGAAAGVGAAGGPGAADPAAAGAASGEVVVHVAGAVGEPGVQRLPAGSRVVDAVGAAGGAGPDADLGRVNLAAPLQDGQQVYLPKVGEAPPAAPAGGAPGDAGGASGPSPPGAAGPPINVNTASAAELEALPGVGPATAEAIVAHRDQNGPFTAVDQLIDVRGIGEVKLAQLRDHVTV
jgi:competence protein ComEA